MIINGASAFGVILKRTHLFRGKADEEREDNLRECTYTYVSAGCHSATKYPTAYKKMCRNAVL